MINKDRYLQASTPREAVDVRILVISPSNPIDDKDGPFPVTSDERKFLLPRTLVDEVLCKGAPNEISNDQEAKQAIPIIVEKAMWAESRGYDAIIINCMIDPGLDEVRLKVNIPVIGAGRAAMGLATSVAERPARIFPNSVPINQLATRKEEALQELQDVSQRQIQTRGVDVLLLNCVYLGGAANRLQSRIGAPVMPTTEIALRTAETIVLLGIKPIRPDVKAARVSEFRQSIFRTKDNLLHLKCIIKKKAGETLAKLTGAGSGRR
jgi:allantoin racemase